MRRTEGYSIMQKDYGKEQIVFAGFWVRLAAYVIDSVVVGAGLLVIRLLMSGVMALLEGTVLGGNLLFSYDLKDIVVYLGGVLYFILCTYYTGTTLGKKALNLRVVGTASDEKIPLFNVIYRETVGRFLSGFFAGLGYLLIAADKEKRGLHDILGDTRVIYAKNVKLYPQYTKMPPYGQGINMPPRPIAPQGSYHMAEPGQMPLQERPMPPQEQQMPSQSGEQDAPTQEQ